MKKSFFACLLCSVLFFRLELVNADSSVPSTVTEKTTTVSTTFNDVNNNTADDSELSSPVASTSSDVDDNTSNNPEASSPVASTSSNVDNNTSNNPESSSPVASTSSDVDDNTTNNPSEASSPVASTSSDVDDNTSNNPSEASSPVTSTSSDVDDTTTDDDNSTTIKVPTSTYPDSSPMTDLSTVTATPEPTTPSHVKYRTSFTWRSKDMENNPIVFEVEDGYFISVTVSNVDMSNGNYLLIEAGNSHSDESTDGRVFANTVAGPLKYLFKTSSVYAFCENSIVDGENPVSYDFTVIFERTGEPTTVVSTTTSTPISVPPTEPGDSSYITVNVSGRPLDDYNNFTTVEAFQECVVLMATNYCKQQSIDLTKDITREYVVIGGISQCPYNWPESSNCAQIRFKLPIFYNESSAFSGYQLNTNNLEVMWLRWDEFDQQCLLNNSFEVYTEPNVERSIMWWAIGISLVTVAFIVLLWFLRTCSSRMKAAIRKRTGRESDTVSIMQRESVSSLTPHYLQDHLDTPKFFET